MKTKSGRSFFPAHLGTLAVISALLLANLHPALAQTPLLSIQLYRTVSRPGQVAVRSDGSLAVSGEFFVNATDPAGLLALLDANGRLIRRLPPLLSPADENGDRFRRHDSFEIAYPDGRFLVIDRAGHLLRLNADGSLDEPFNARLGMNWVNQAKLQPDGRILLAGGFNGLPFRRVEGDGAEDQGFKQKLATQGLQPESGFLAWDRGDRFFAITFARVNGCIRCWDEESAIALRMNPDGTWDPSFHPSASVSQFARGVFLPLADGRLFARSNPSRPHLIDGVEITSDLARLNSDGSLDHTFEIPPEVFANPQVGQEKHCLGEVAPMADGKLVISVSGNPEGYQLYRLNPNGSLDGSFASPYSTRTVVQLVAQPDGKLLVIDRPCAGLSGPCLNNALMRLNADGSVDTTFDASALSDSFIRAATIGAVNLLPGRNYTLEVSTGLPDWSPLETQSTGVGDFLGFEDQAARSNDVRFYRLVSP